MKKHRIVTYLLFIFITLFKITASQIALTPKFDCGRLGDRLLNYSKAKFISYKYKIPMVMKLSEAMQFEQFPLLEKLNTIYENFEDHFNETIDVYSKKDFDSKLKSLDKEKNILFLISWFLDVDPYKEKIKDKNFEEELKTCLKPKVNQKNKFKIKKDVNNVAVHIRRGDIKYDKTFPLKSPPIKFYCDQIINLSNYLNNGPINIYIFTDEENKEELLSKLKDKVNIKNINYILKDSNPNDINSILEDMLDISELDYLIRPCSSFSKISQYLGNHSVIISPMSCTFHDDKLFITSIQIHIRKDGKLFELVYSTT